MKNNTITYTIIALFFILIKNQETHAQGCIAVRPMGCAGGNASAMYMAKGQWQLGANYRYFQSYKHYKGDVEQVERVEQNTQVINDANSIDLSLSYSLSPRLTLNASLPFIKYDRSSLYEHYGNALSSNPQQLRFSTHARGIGDLRLSASYWLIDPVKAHKGNIAIGLGIKAPTGNANVLDNFHRLTKEKKDSIVVRAVDQSIQLGDGGWGFSLETQGFWTVFPKTAVYFNAFYMSNPRNVNNTLNRGTLVGVDPLIAYHSISDQYAARLGVTHLILPKWHIAANLGGRMEGIPAHDIIGKSEGFRRPGYVVSVEPGISSQFGNINAALTVPVALYRNRVKSVYDLADPTGQRHGDAAFANYLVNATITYRFGKKHTEMPHVPMWDTVTNNK